MTDRTSNYANAFKTTLSSDMASTDLIANVVSTAGAPATPCYLAIDANDATKREYIFFDGSQTGTSLATSALGNRYLAGSAASSGIVHSAGAEVTQVPSAQSFADLHDRIDADETVNAAHRTHATPVTAHSALTGLTADDHSAVYLNTARHDLTARHGSAVVDHGLAGGLGDDDHPHYLNATRHNSASHTSANVDHGSQAGLGDDDHPHYLNTTRHTADAHTNLLDAARHDIEHDDGVTRLHGRGSALFGSPPAAGTGQFRIQAGTIVATTDANGYLTVSFPSAFPTGLLSVVFVIGESPGGAQMLAIGPDISLISPGNASQFSIRVFGTAGNIFSNTSIRLNWIAIGW